MAGTERNAISKETGLLQEWPEAGPPLAWKTTGLGGGDSAPAIAAGRIFGMSHRGEDEVVWALSEADGKELWVARWAAVQQRMPQSKEGRDARRRSMVNGSMPWAGRHLACLQVSDGKCSGNATWSRTSGGRATWITAITLIDGDKLICTPGGDERCWRPSTSSTATPSGRARSPPARREGLAATPTGSAGRPEVRRSRGKRRPRRFRRFSPGLERPTRPPSPSTSTAAPIRAAPRNSAGWSCGVRRQVPLEV